MQPGETLELRVAQFYRRSRSVALFEMSAGMAGRPVVGTDLSITSFMGQAATIFGGEQLAAGSEPSDHFGLLFFSIC